MGQREVMFKYMYSAHRDGRGEGSAGTFYYNALLLHTLYILPSYRYVCVPLTELEQASSNVKGGVYVTVCVCPVISERRPLFSKHFSISRADRIHREREGEHNQLLNPSIWGYSSAVYNLNAFKSNYLAVVQSCISLSGFKRVFRKKWDSKAKKIHIIKIQTKHRPVCARPSLSGISGISWIFLQQRQTLFFYHHFTLDMIRRRLAGFLLHDKCKCIFLHGPMRQDREESECKWEKSKTFQAVLNVSESIESCGRGFPKV